jgi:hypothetical protein
MFGDRNRRQLGAVHAAKGNQVAVDIDGGDVHRATALVGLGNRGLSAFHRIAEKSCAARQQGSIKHGERKQTH